MSFPAVPGLRAAQALFPGILISVVLALSAQFIADHYGAPAMLMALLFGIALNFLSNATPCSAGIAFSARSILRIGVALLGMRMSYEMASDLGVTLVLVVAGSVSVTIAFGLAVSRFFGIGPKFAFLSAGSVAICGASAALAISAILPRDERSDERTVFTVVGVTLLSTVAMIVYPVVAQFLALSDRAAGVFLGGTIHDVAQVVGAGFSVSQETGEVATVVKLIRVAMLAPVVMIASLYLRGFGAAGGGGKRPPLVPLFVLGFAVLAGLNSIGLFPEQVTALSATVSRWALLVAIAAVGLKTNLHDVIDVGGAAIMLLVAETLFIASLIVTAILVLGIG